MKIFFPILIVSLLLSFSSFGQNKVPEIIQRTYFYSFTNASSIDQINALKSDVEALKNVVKVKSEYKSERSAGQIIVIIEEETRTSEGQEFFNIVDLKRLILENNLMPHELKEENRIVGKK